MCFHGRSFVALISHLARVLALSEASYTSAQNPSVYETEGVVPPTRKKRALDVRTPMNSEHSDATYNLVCLRRAPPVEL